MPEINDKNLQNLSRLLTALDEERITKKEFVDWFEKVVKMVLKNQEQIQQAITQLEETYDNLIYKLRDEHAGSLKELKDKTSTLFVKDTIDRMFKEHTDRMKRTEEKLRFVDERMSKVRDGRDGVSIRGERGPEGRPGLLSLEALNALKEEMRKEMDERVKTTAVRGGVRKTKFVSGIPTGTIDGANTIFYLPTTPDSDSFLLVLNGMLQRNGSTYEYVLANKTITYNTAPPSGSQHYFWFART